MLEASTRLLYLGTRSLLSTLALSIRLESVVSLSIQNEEHDSQFTALYGVKQWLDVQPWALLFRLTEVDVIEK